MSKERPSTPPLHEEIDIKNEEAQKWLEKNHGNNKDSVTEIGVNITFDEVKVKLTGSLLISDYSELKSIDLWEGEITELIIKNCPKVEEIE
ncbi:886_t:CDS:1, partial [Racocetra persica]